jgi:putative Mn2+ efflux pump MntP
MSWFAVLGIAVGLAMDAFAVSIAAGLVIQQPTYRHVFRLAFHFGLFQFLMPVIGWMAGRTVSAYVSAYDHWVAFGLLAWLGGKMMWAAMRGEQNEGRGDPSRGLLLVSLTIATSIDALAAGLSMAFLGVSIWMPSAVIGLVTATLSVVGVCFGSRIGARFGRMAEFAGGVVLLAIGIRIVASHLT